MHALCTCFNGGHTYTPTRYQRWEKLNLIVLISLHTDEKWKHEADDSMDSELEHKEKKAPKEHEVNEYLDIGLRLSRKSSSLTQDAIQESIISPASLTPLESSSNVSTSGISSPNHSTSDTTYEDHFNEVVWLKTNELQQEENHTTISSPEMSDTVITSSQLDAMFEHENHLDFDHTPILNSIQESMSYILVSLLVPSFPQPLPFMAVTELETTNQGQ